MICVVCVRLPDALVVEEEERAVLPDRAADACAEQVVMQDRDLGCEEAARIQVRVAEYSYAEPCNSLVPDLVVIWMTPPPVRPNSAE